jgi:uncharacterized alpha-E superfamily protein
MLSRTADAIYWLNRYVERADSYARFLDVNLQLMLDSPQGEQWLPVVETTGDAELFHSKYDSADRDSVLRFLISDEDNPSSIWSCVRTARENTKSARELLSSELWISMNQFYIELEETVHSLSLVENLPAFFSWVKEKCALHQGLLDSSVSRTEAWHFGCLGRYMERADKTSRLLDIKYFYLLPDPGLVGTDIDLLQWQAVLKSASALEAFRRTEGSITPASVANFLILNPAFPRSIRFCMKEVERSLRAVSPGDPELSYRNAAEKRAGAFRSELDYSDIADIFRSGLHESLDTIQLRLNEIGASIQELFLVSLDSSEPESDRAKPVHAQHLAASGIESDSSQQQQQQ